MGNSWKDRCDAIWLMLRKIGPLLTRTKGTYSVIEIPLMPGNSELILAWSRGHDPDGIVAQSWKIYGLLLLSSLNVGSHRSRGPCTMSCTWASVRVVPVRSRIRVPLAS
jgi:hypothetical protein